MTINMRITYGVQEKLSYDVLCAVGAFISKFTNEELEDEGTLVIMIKAIGAKEIELWTLIGEEGRKVSQKYKTIGKAQNTSVNYCVMGEESLLCMAYEN